MRRCIALALTTTAIVLACVIAVIRVAPRLERKTGIALAEAVARSGIESLKPGYGICLFDVEGPLWSRYGGEADENSHAPFTEDTIFRVGAVSELFTSAVVLRLADENKLRLDDPVKAYLPDLFREVPQEGSLTKIGELRISTLLSHLSGSNANFFLGLQDYEPSRTIGRYLAGTALQYPSNVKYIRAGALIDLLGCVIEGVSGAPFDRVAQDMIFDPLEMKASTFKYRSDRRYASIRYKSAAPNSYPTQLPGLWNVVVPSGSMQSSIRDLAVFYSTLLGDGSRAKKEIVSPEALALMFSSKSENARKLQGMDVGYVWMLSLPELEYLGHVAWYSGKFLSHRNVVILARDLGVGVVVATNAWHIFDKETIFPVAIDVLKTYAALTLGKSEPSAVEPPTIEPPSGLLKACAGSYSSAFGYIEIALNEDAIFMEFNGGYEKLTYRGEGTFLPEKAGRIARIIASPPASLTIILRNGTMIEAHRITSCAGYLQWGARSGTYRSADVAAGAKVGPGAFILLAEDGFVTIAGADGIHYVIIPTADNEAKIECPETSSFFGKTLVLAGEHELLLGGALFRK